ITDDVVRMRPRSPASALFPCTTLFRSPVRVLRAQACVDAVAVFDEDTPERLLADLRPDVWVKGGDYAATDLPEATLLDAWGGQAVLLPYLAGRSSTGILERATERGR